MCRPFIGPVVPGSNVTAGKSAGAMRMPRALDPEAVVPGVRALLSDAGADLPGCSSGGMAA